MRTAVVAFALVAAAACGDSTATSSTTTASTAAPETTTGVQRTTTTSTVPTTTSTVPTTASTTTATTTTGPSVIVLVATYVGGQVEADADRVKIPLGSDVELQVTSDVAEELHVHGYDFFIDLEPGVPGSLLFTADIPGIFEVELERSLTPLLELEVS